MPDRRDILKGAGAAMLLAMPAVRRATASGQIPDLDGVTIVAHDQGYDPRLFAAYNAETAHIPAIRALCDSPQGVAQTLNWALSEGCTFAIRSTSHCFAGHSQHPDLVIDTSRLNWVLTGQDDDRVNVGAGAQTGDVHLRLAQAGRGMAGGTHASVGMAGITLGGGIGHMSRFAGLACDQLEKLTIIDATGNLRRINAENEPDLFWAFQGGGGGSLGIVTDLTYRTFALSNLAEINIHIIVPPQEAARIVHDWQYWSQSLSRQTTTHLQLTRYVNNTFLLSFSGLSQEPKESVKRHFSFLLGPNHPVPDHQIIVGEASAIMTRLYGVPHYLSSLHILSHSEIVADPIPLDGIKNLLDQLAKFPVNALHMNFEAIGGAVGDRIASDSAFPHRDGDYVLHFTRTLSDNGERVPAQQAFDAAIAAMATYVTSGKYVNYPEPDLDNWADAYWGENLPRLKRVKRKYDPGNVFNHAQSIPLD